VFLGDENQGGGGRAPGPGIRVCLAQQGTKKKGEAAELAFMLKAVSLGFGVAKPWGDSERYDFILDTGTRLWRVQVKSGSHSLVSPLVIEASRRSRTMQRSDPMYIRLLSFRIATGLYQLLLAAFSRLRVQPTNLLPAGMEITSYNHHAKAPSFPEALVLNRRLPVSDRAFALIQSSSRGFREVGSTEAEIGVGLAVCAW